MNTTIETIRAEENNNKDLAIANKDNLINLKIHWIWYILGAICFIITIVYLVKANAYLDGTARMMGDYYDSMAKKYVGGDAYNYIIAGTYSTTITIRALIFCVLGIGSIIIGKISSLKN